MRDFLISNSFFALSLTLGAFFASRSLQTRWKSPLLNPILVAAIAVSLVLLALDIPTDSYQAGCAPLQYMLTPATICYAVTLYEQLQSLKKHLPTILTGVISGTFASLLSIQAMCAAFGLDARMTATLLPKSITTAIGMALSEEAGGLAALTTAAIVLTGILGNMFGPAMCRFFRIQDPIAQGTAFGTASHAVGTSKATELSSLAGAVSSLSLTFAGLLTVVVYSILI